MTSFKGGRTETRAEAAVMTDKSFAAFRKLTGKALRTYRPGRTRRSIRLCPRGF
ncbi:hypothetical protein D3P09_16975 [Paenibacillus pinisoli]|uniref:Uncharacterized protein n=1 Tax=Paenibacillus pinisoli TaxID=1276110 RepID=A0A3A6PTV9_9BACL|nr:hypothetical protein D3P09_16975 [Paenibacillus pinisoli]